MAKPSAGTAIPNQNHRTILTAKSPIHYPKLQSVYLHDWWLMKVESDSNGWRLGVGGFSLRWKLGIRVFCSSTIAKRHDNVTLETVDGITITVSGFINRSHTLQNGFSFESYKGDKEMLGKCEQLFMELMKVPRVEFKLKVLLFKIQFSSKVNYFRHNLTTINDAVKEVKESTKLRQIMQTILSLVNQDILPGCDLEFGLYCFDLLSDTHARNSKMTSMHSLCKLLVEKMPGLLYFDEDLVHLEAASSVQLMSFIVYTQGVIRDIRNVELELTASENDGAISAGFREVFKSFPCSARDEEMSLMMLYSEAKRNADSLAKYFGEDPAQTTFEEVRSTLVVFVTMFKKVRDENEEQAAVNSLSTEEDNEVNSENGMKT